MKKDLMPSALFKILETKGHESIAFNKIRFMHLKHTTNKKS